MEGGGPASLYLFLKSLRSKGSRAENISGKFDVEDIQERSFRDVLGAYPNK